jgi:transcriptional regulator with XRE-family HTH domain
MYCLCLSKITMAKLLKQSCLGNALKATRQAVPLSKVALARAAHMSRNTVRRAECGQGYLKSFDRLAAVLGLELRGRGLPPGPIGVALKAARLRRHLSVDRIVSMLHSSSATIKRLERDQATRLDVLEAYGNLFGVEFYLAAKRANPEVVRKTRGLSTTDAE